MNNFMKNVQVLVFHRLKFGTMYIVFIDCLIECISYY